MKRTILLSGIACLLLTASCKTHQDPLIDLRNNWYSFISTEVPGYHFTGFTSHQTIDVPVTNNTDYTIDEVENMVDPGDYFRINRGFLVSVRCIDQINDYFGNRLKLNLKPAIDKEALVSREKVTEFKNWMGK